MRANRSWPERSNVEKEHDRTLNLKRNTHQSATDNARHNIELIQKTWEQVLPIADNAAQPFYNCPFELDLSLRSMFSHTDMAEQRKKVMQMITVAVRGLGRLEEPRPAAALGHRDVGYGVQDHHYDAVSAALIWTLEQALGDAFTPEARESWTSTYTTLADSMRAAPAAPPPRVGAAEQTRVQSPHFAESPWPFAHPPARCAIVTTNTGGAPNPPGG